MGNETIEEAIGAASAWERRAFSCFLNQEEQEEENDEGDYDGCGVE